MKNIRGLFLLLSLITLVGCRDWPTAPSQPNIEYDGYVYFRFVGDASNQNLYQWYYVGTVINRSANDLSFVRPYLKMYDSEDSLIANLPYSETTGHLGTLVQPPCSWYVCGFTENDVLPPYGIMDFLVLSDTINTLYHYRYFTQGFRYK